MNNEQQIIQALGLQSASPEVQKNILLKVNGVVDRRLVLAMDEVLDDQKRDEFFKVQELQSDDAAIAWIEANVVNIGDLRQAILHDYLEEKLKMLGS